MIIFKCRKWCFISVAFWGNTLVSFSFSISLLPYVNWKTRSMNFLSMAEVWFNSPSTNNEQQSFQVLCKLDEFIVFRFIENNENHFKICRVKNKINFLSSGITLWNHSWCHKRIFDPFYQFTVYPLCFIISLNVKNKNIILIDQLRELFFNLATNWACLILWY